MKFGGAVFTGNMLEALGETFSDSDRSELLFDVSGNGYMAIELKYLKSSDNEDKNCSRPTHETDPHALDGSSHPDDGSQPTSIMGFTRLLKHGMVSNQIKRQLENIIEEAFTQILAKDFARQYLVSGKTVRIAAIAVHGTSTVMVRFAEVIWDANAEDELDLKAIPLPPQNCSSQDQ
jgi:hypothetical protein